MLKFAFRSYDVPPDGYRWTAPDGGRVIASDRPTWFKKIHKHYSDNGIPIPDNWMDLAEHQLCLVLPPGWSRHETGEGFSGINTRLGLGDYLHGMRVLSEIALSSHPLVDQEIAEERGAKCAACPANVPVAGCAPCVGISNLIVGIKGAETTKADHVLKTCAICKCNCSAMIWIRPEILAKTVDATQMAQMRIMPDCWKVKLLDSLS